MQLKFEAGCVDSVDIVGSLRFRAGTPGTRNASKFYGPFDGVQPRVSGWSAGNWVKVPGWIGVILVTPLISLTCTACTQDYPLPRPIACDAVLAIRIGMTENEVIRLVGRPDSSGPDVQTAEDGTRIDTMAYYGRSYAPEDMTFWDHFIVGYAGGKVVAAGASRVQAGGRHQVPGGGNPRTAFRLRRDPSKPDEDARPVVGPAMGEVFDCGTRRDGK